MHALSSFIRLLFCTHMHVCMYVCCRLVGLYVTHVHTARFFNFQENQTWTAAVKMLECLVGFGSSSSRSSSSWSLFFPLSVRCGSASFSDTWAPHPQNRWGNKSFEITRKTRASAEQSGSLWQRERARWYVVSSRGKWWVVSLPQKYPLFERTS